MIISTRKKTTKYHATSYHNSYGIQKWLVSRKFILDGNRTDKVNKEEYISLIKDFCEQVDGWKPEKVKGVHTYESFIQNMFPDFCSYCIERFTIPAEINYNTYELQQR